MDKRSEALPPWYFNRSLEEIEELINSKVNLKKLSFLWENPKFHLQKVGGIDPPETWYPISENDGVFLLYLSYDEIDADFIDQPEKRYKKYRFETRKWALPANVSDDEIERTVYKLLQNSLEHRLGEFYFWDEARIHSPHISLRDKLYISFEKTLERYLKGVEELKE